MTTVAAPPREAVAFDLEGGLINVARIHHLAGDASQFHTAMLRCPANHNTLKAVQRAHVRGKTILVMTGAGRNLEPAVSRWLARYKVPTNLVLMRGRGDFRPSAVVKREKLRHVHHQFPSLTVWSDDPSVIRLSERDGMDVLALSGYWGEVA